MILVRYITSALLICTLVLMTGLSATAHAMSPDCVDGDCDTHMAMPSDAHHTMGTEAEEGGSSHLSDETEHDGCNPYLCNVLAFSPQVSATDFTSSRTNIIWQVAQFSGLEKPDNLDRPPNL